MPPPRPHAALRAAAPPSREALALLDSLPRGRRRPATRRLVALSILCHRSLLTRPLPALEADGPRLLYVTLAARLSVNPTLQSRDEGFIAAKQNHDRLRRLVQSGKGTAQDVTALRAAETTLADATASRETYLAGLRAAGLATLSGAQSTLVTRINGNRSWGLPTQYLAKDRSEADWVALRDALAVKRISEEDPEEVFAPSAQTYLASADGAAEVSTAKVNLDSNIAAVQTAWNTAATD